MDKVEEPLSHQTQLAMAGHGAAKRKIASEQALEALAI
jgi:hypothetical protein